MSVLIAIASAHNTTTEIGKRIAARLQTHLAGPIEVLPASEVPADAVPKYSAVIVGSAIQMGSWLSPARKFIAKEKTALNARPVWAFSVGVPGTKDYEVRETENIVRDIKKTLPELKGHTLFQGRIEIGQLAWPVALFFKWFPQKGKFGDFVEMEAVDNWADQVGEEIKKGVVKE